MFVGSLCWDCWSAPDTQSYATGVEGNTRAHELVGFAATTHLCNNIHAHTDDGQSGPDSKIVSDTQFWDDDDDTCVVGIGVVVVGCSRIFIDPSGPITVCRRCLVRPSGFWSVVCVACSRPAITARPFPPPPLFAHAEVALDVTGEVITLYI